MDTNGTTLMQASRQWASRPDDQRFTSLTELHAFCNASRLHSSGRVVSSRSLTAQPLEGIKSFAVKHLPLHHFLVKMEGIKFSPAKIVGEGESDG